MAITAWPQRFTRSRTAFLLSTRGRNEILALADQAVTSATNFLTSVIIGRVCIKDELGLYMLGFSIVIFLIGLENSLITSPYTVYVARLKDKAQNLYTGSTLIHQVGLSTLAVVSLVIALVVLSLGVGPKGLAAVLLALVGAITFIMLREFSRRVCFAQLRMNSALLVDSCVAVLQIGGLLLLTSLGVLNASRAYWVIGVACGLPTMYWLYSIRNQLTLRLNNIILDLMQNWSFGKWLLAGILVSMAGVGLYPWLLTGFHGTTATGELAACTSVIFLANPFLMGMGNFLGPKTAHALANHGIDRLRRTIVRATFLIATVIGIFCIAMFLLGEVILTLMYGSHYGGKGLVIGVLALSKLVESLAIPMGCGLLAMERSDITFKVNLLALIITISLGLWLVKSFGLVGVALALLVSDLARATLIYIVFTAQGHHYVVDEASA